METHSEFSDTYIIVCGMPRCGTRQFADFLGKHPQVCLQNEIGEAFLREIASLVSKADKAYKEEHSRMYFAHKRREVLIRSIGLFSKGRIIHKPGNVIHGFKTPGVELLFEELNRVFTPSFRKVHYLFCIRNCADCYLSLRSMPWFKMTKDEYIARYLSSLKSAVNMRYDSCAREDARFGVNILNLDSFIATRKQAAWIRDKLFAPIEIAVSTSFADEIRITTKNTNATLNKYGKERPKELGSEDYEYFARRSDEIEAGIRDFNLAFEENLGVAFK